MAISSFIAGLLLQCPTAVDPDTLNSIIQVESGGNQYAVAVVQKKTDNDFISYKVPANLEEDKAWLYRIKNKQLNLCHMGFSLAN